MVTSLKRSQACTATVCAPNPKQAATDPSLCRRLPDTHRQVSCGVTAPFSWVLVHKVLLCPPRVYFPVLCKLWQLYSGVIGNPLQEDLCHTHTKSPCPCSRPLPTGVSTGDAQTQFCLGLCGVLGSWCTQGLSEPSELLWRERGLILNVDSPLLPSCWGFSFVLGRGVSPHSHSSAYWGFSDFGRGGISTRQVQRSAAATPDLGCGVVAPGMSLQFISGMSE